MRVFRWLNEQELPPECDLRHCGWYRLSRGRHRSECVALANPAMMTSTAWQRLLALHGHEDRRLIMLLGIADPGDRARLLHMGFGEVLGPQFELKELEARALRLIELEHMLPRFRQFGILRLDLLTRDGFVTGEPLRLHPREFGLLWRLSDQPGEPVGKRQLIKDVWQLRIVPETNSLAVHISRLRAKLKVFGIADMLQTTPRGDYVLTVNDSRISPEDVTAQAKTG